MTPRIASTTGGPEQRRPAISDSSILDAAIHYMELGWRIIPLHRVGPDGTCSCRFGKGCKTPGKHPLDLKWSGAAPMSAPDIYATWDMDRPPNIGIVTGEPSDFWVLDIDPGAGGFQGFRDLINDNEKLPPTKRFKTGSGGYHLLFKIPAGFKPKTASNVLKKLGYPGIDVRGVGGQIVAPPSRSNKGDYSVATDGPILDPPQWLVDLIPQVTDAVEVELDDDDLLERSEMTEAELRTADRYIDAAVAGVVKDLEALPRPWREGAGWDQGIHRAACRLFELAQQSWSKLTYREAFQLLDGHAPRDDVWGSTDIAAKWDSAQNTVGKKALPRPKGEVDDTRMDDWGFEDKPVAKADKPAPAPVKADVQKRTWDDFGNAERLNDRVPGRIRWIEERGGWAHYDGSTWRIDGTNHVPHQARRTLETLAKTEAELYSEDPGEDESGKPTKSERDQFLAFASKQRFNARLEAMLKVARTLPAHSARMSDFDADPMMLNCRNAAVDLRTGELVPHSPDLMMMHQAQVDYDPDAKAPQWQAFLDRVLPDPEMQAFLARAVGYTLNGLTGEQVMFIHHGSGANGKSVFLKVMEEILGDYSQTVPRTTLLTKSNESVPTDVARMVGKRFLQTSETAAGRRLDEEVVKGLTGGEKQTARFLHRDFFDFTPTGTIHYVTNHLPRLTNAESIWRRLVLIGWNVVIPPEERDPHLADRIIAQESAGVLAWAIRGAVEYQEKRLSVPESCRLALEEYREDVDLLGDFIKECLIPGLDESITTPVSRIYEAYQAWCFRSGIRQPMVVNDLSAALTERNMQRARKYVDGKQQRCFLGLGLAVSPSFSAAHAEELS
jgi:putative DNA primase/helicase